MKRLAIVWRCHYVEWGGLGVRPALGHAVRVWTASSARRTEGHAEMWFYDQAARQYRDPKLAVRAKAEFRTEQRLRRIESMKWFGMSNARPQANSDPYHGDYSPRWVSKSRLLSVALERRGPVGRIRGMGPAVDSACGQTHPLCRDEAGEGPIAGIAASNPSDEQDQSAARQQPVP